jgi:cellulose biosynthesis protein BcsQ
MIITLARFKGGVGKATTAIHLAAFFHGDAETLLIEADPNRSALAWANDAPQSAEAWQDDDLIGQDRLSLTGGSQTQWGLGRWAPATRAALALGLRYI